MTIVENGYRKRGRGNHRTGRARGMRGRKGTLEWRKDSEVLRRLELVAELYNQPVATIHQVVNMRLEELGKEPVSLQTIQLDRKRARELISDRVGQGIQHHLVELEQVKYHAWKDVNRTQPGSRERPPFYAAILSAIKAQAMIDGSWGAMREPPAPEGTPVEGFGPAPAELLQQGKITEDQYRAWLVVMWSNTGGRPTTREAAPVADIPELSGPGPDVVDGVAVEVPEEPARPRSRPRRPPAGGGNGAGSGPRMSGSSGLDEEPADSSEVVDWQPGGWG